ncbi:type II toxin-antitoxin system VapC family toxin [Georgenia sunbinii]|uniref:type II toxin-antitoxin system VapC family toxin n=1 Tax=Georgenia sunbinii TaxID=3117728 RepID=UPI002F262537
MTVVLDTSALSAVIFGETDAESLLAAMQRHAGGLTISAATAVEAGIVIEAKQGPEATADLHALLDALQVSTTAVDGEQIAVAVAAWRRFGKGRHPAALNFGDCFSYALARTLGASLLFKGRDFAQTDILSAA